MRTRTRTTINEVASWSSGTCPFGQAACSGATNSGTTSYGARSVNVDYETESISDALGRGKVNPVTHTKEHWSHKGNNDNSRAYGSTDMGNSVITYTGWPGRPGMAVDVFNAGSSLLSSWSFASGTVNEAAMKNDVLEKAKALKADVLLNLVEANQIWPSIKSLAGSMPIMADNWKQIRRNIRTGSGAFLAWKFGIAPILSDVMNIVRYAPKLGSDLKRHAQGDKNRFVSTKQFELTYTPGLITFPAGSFFRITSQGRLLKKPTVRYVLVVEPTTRYHTDFFQKLDLVMHRFASSPASLLWEKIPFSFMADWFVDIRGALTALDNVLGFHPYKIIGFSRSYSYAHGTDIFGDWLSPCNGGIVDSMKAGSYELEYYERTPVSGGIIPNLNTHFGKNQAGITAALIAQQLSKLRAK